jgi:hypothetical protein
MRWGAILLGCWALTLWIVGLATHATPWLTWLHGAGAAAAFAIAVSAHGKLGVARASLETEALALGLFMLWIAAMATHATPWLRGWTCALACVCLFLGAFVEAGADFGQPRPPEQSIG